MRRDPLRAVIGRAAAGARARLGRSRMTPLERRSVELWATGSWLSTTWLGFPIAQLPQDLVALQELIVEVRPEVIVETGLFQGGSAVFYASMLELCGIDGEVVSVDVDPDPALVERLAAHPLGRRVRVVRGGSTGAGTVARVVELVAGRRCGLVSLDSDHRRDHVAAELTAYAPLVPVGGFICVFDGIAPAIVASGLRPGYGESAAWRDDNPLLAVRDFLAAHPHFTASPRNARLGATFAPEGFLERTR